jgi:REP element-mobilizing transposase RayT
MADVFSQIDLHIVFAVKYRQALLAKEWRDDVYKYITGIIQNYGHKLLSIGGVEDHIHIFIGYKHTQLLSDLVKEIKNSSNDYIKSNNLCKQKFAWQNGYGVFSHNISQRDVVINYILNQEEHHSKKPFKKEYILLLEKSQIEFKDEYLFEFFE